MRRNLLLPSIELILLTVVATKNTFLGYLRDFKRSAGNALMPVDGLACVFVTL